MGIIKTFLIATVQDRTDGLRTLLLSSQMYRKEWRYVIVAQSYTDEDQRWLNEFVQQMRLNADIIYVDHGIGPGRAKRLGISRFKSDIWVSLDDDMEMIPGKTDYESMVSILESRPEIGFLSANWAKTLKQAEAKEIKDSLVKQAIVYTGGGMMFRGDVAETLLQEMPDEPWLFDNVAWSLAIYTSGYENYRYLGSVAIHRICTKGGRKRWVSQGTRKLPDRSLINVRPAFNNAREMEIGNCWCICSSSDLTPKAKELHRMNKEAKYAGREKIKA